MIQYILTDIEGTTTSVSFVYQTLFPYFSTHFRAFAEKNYPNFGLENNIEAVKSTILEEKNEQINNEQAIDVLLDWVKQDRKHTALKNLQGEVWRMGYQNGEIKGHIYADVPPALEKWKNAGLKMGVYSSGSVDAQKLIFGFSEFGDLTNYFDNYFDTNIGHKREAQSYQNIQQILAIPAINILFLSDIEAELDAAKATNFQTCQLLRGEVIASEKHQTVSDFGEVQGIITN